MLYRDIFKILGIFLLGFSAIMMVPFGVAYYYQFLADPAAHPQPHTTLYFLESMLISFAVGGGCYWLGRHSDGQLFKKECLLVVVLVWFLTPALASLPFLLSGTLADPSMAYFEMVSGLTTTGSTVLHAKKYDASGNEIPIEKTFGNEKQITYSFYGTVPPVRDPATGAVLYEGIEAVSKALLFWRSFIEWLGGGGVMVLFVAVLSSLAISGKTLFQLEVAGPVKDAFTPRVKEGALRLWTIYVALTSIQTLVLLWVNQKMEILDAVTIAFASLSTGGFSIRNANIGFYNDPSTEWVIMLFMFLGSINFALYYYALRGKFYRLYETEFISYIGILLAGCCLGAWYLSGAQKAPLSLESSGEAYTTTEAIRYGFFQIISAQSTTGFFTANYDKWPFVVQALMVIAMFIGGMSGSTAGGIKVMRHLILFSVAKYKIESLFSPKKIQQIRVAGQSIDNSIAVTTLCFFFILVAVSVFGTFLYIANEIDPSTAFGLVACMVSNAGLSFAMAGPLDSCAFLSDFSLLLSALLMVLGRLEFFVVLAVLAPAFWHQTNRRIHVSWHGPRL